jgi:hypothetical protein
MGLGAMGLGAAAVGTGSPGSRSSGSRLSVNRLPEPTTGTDPAFLAGVPDGEFDSP